MTDEKDYKKDEKEERDEEEDEDENVEKAYDVISDTLKAVVESQKTILESHRDLVDGLNGLSDRVKTIENPAKAPSGFSNELDATPKVSDKDDIGAKIKIPNNEPYQTGIQAGLDDDGKETGDDQKGLQIEQKAQRFVEKSEHTFSTETPRPSVGLENVDKSITSDYSQILKDARGVGFDGLSSIALKIQKGDYYKPSNEEVGLI